MVRPGITTFRAVPYRHGGIGARFFNMPHALTDDQMSALRLVRGDSLPPGPLTSPRTRIQDRNLLMVLRLIELRGASFRLTTRGAEYLERAELETLADEV